MRCLIVDDSANFRTAASAMLGRGGVDVVGAASNSDEALRMCRELQPDVVLVDVALGPESGFDLADELDGSALPTPPAVILISTYAEQDLHEMIACSPAVGFVPKFALSVAAIEYLLARC
ncbi:LytR/AlgR family response regulator transcription factor [Mycolicibacterium wolinskyi]|uniref:Chemotaxis protein CheY n=1 Tax=Mycolicibacterium wolinskyi TaxID=59750 RepID=A0A132PND9_9MYCO|nr:response regulator [Mycolicibacterium wolinskyi]KWX23859.1 chemotaxis protein CheY [Mycolicibacterium wolinskyi]